MKSYISTVALSLLVLLAIGTDYLSAQSISAEEIMRMINDGKDIELNNVTIEGDLDLTKLDNMRQVSKDNGRAQMRSTVKVDLSFTGCVFNDGVFGFVNEENGWKSKEPIYHADFQGDVKFTNCRFQREAEFKYSDFGRSADFRGSYFRKEANFKYTEFAEGASFANARFDRDANFKYTKFRESGDFSSSAFEGEADFKYTNFSRGVTFADALFENEADFKYTDLGRDVSFAGADFKGSADFKYIKFPAGTNLTNTSFGRYTDFKYATLGGKKFSR